MLNRSASLAMSTCVLKALPGKLDIKRHSPSILYITFLLLYRSVPASFVVKSDGSLCVSSALRKHVESLSKPRDVNMRSQSLAW